MATKRMRLNVYIDMEESDGFLVDHIMDLDAVLDVDVIDEDVIEEDEEDDD